MINKMGIENKAIETVDFTVKYPNDIVGCEKISISFPAKEVTAIIGPSGCGKSTFLKGINRLTDEFGCRYSGSVFLSDRVNVLELGQYQLCDIRGYRVGYVMQKPAPFSGKTILQDVAMPLRAIGIKDPKIIKEKVEIALRKAALFDEVSDRLNRLSTELSGGQQQRLCIARAVISMPEVLLFDEPCSALDPKSTQLIEQLMDQLAKEHTIILVTHNMQQAQRVAKRTAFFYEGKLVEYNYTDQLFSTPQHQLTADYIIGKFS
ncbi:MAG: phosphate ABC transporter ATP-binding protein [Nitrospinota bacterium]